MKEGQSIFLQMMKGEFRQCKMEGHQLGRSWRGWNWFVCNTPKPGKTYRVWPATNRDAISRGYANGNSTNGSTNHGSYAWF